MSKKNPFEQSMTRLQLPEHMGTSVSARGFTLDADDDRCVDVPPDMVAELVAHGLTAPQPKKAAGK